ncbi:MAG TPA: YlxR family protein [Solirubrobacteraceae bacterium]
MPLRRCAGCGRVAPKTELVRLALTGEDPSARRVVLDRAATMPGRGAYLCVGTPVDRPDSRCLKLASSRQGLARTLRARAPIDAELVESLCS